MQISPSFMVSPVASCALPKTGDFTAVQIRAESVARGAADGDVPAAQSAGAMYRWRAAPDIDRRAFRPADRFVQLLKVQAVRLNDQFIRSVHSHSTFLSVLPAALFRGGKNPFPLSAEKAMSCGFSRINSKSMVSSGVFSRIRRYKSPRGPRCRPEYSLSAARPG